jgi:hypothetical protein
MVRLTADGDVANRLLDHITANSMRGTPMCLYSRVAGAIGLVLLLGIASPARADIIYNNLGPGGSFSDDGLVLAGPQNPSSARKSIRLRRSPSARRITM